MRAWDWQKALLRRRLAALDAGLEPPDELLVLQHLPVYTLGTGSTLANLRFDPASPPFELHRTERGGEATYHGPGQLVLYPILDLKCVTCRAVLSRSRLAADALGFRRAGSTTLTCIGTCARWRRWSSARSPRWAFKVQRFAFVALQQRA